jgi:guanylate kinase
MDIELGQTMVMQSRSRRQGVNDMPPGLVLTGTRGSGKSAVAAVLLARGEFTRPVGVTTRPPRPDDQGAYAFLSAAEFTGLEQAGRLAVSSYYAGQCYGVDRRELDRIRHSGLRPLLTLTPEAAARFGQSHGWRAVFLDASDGVLDQRLRARGGPFADGDHAQRRDDRGWRDRFRLVWNDGDLAVTVAAVLSVLGAAATTVRA